MELDKIKTYFHVVFDDMGKDETFCYLFPENEFVSEQYTEIDDLLQIISKKFEGSNITATFSTILINICVDVSRYPKKCHDEIIEAVISAMNNITGIMNALITDDGSLMDYADIEIEENDMVEEIFWDDALGLTNLDLSYNAHVDGFDGECFDYSVYFADDTADETKADAVRNAVQSFDFNVTGDDYIGYLSISSDNNKVSIYLDLGNVQPQNENKIIQGILLALNSVQGIKKVIINEGCL